MTKMLLHELHPSVVHAPLVLIPTAVTADLIAASTGDRGWARAGRALWIAGSLSGLFAGVAGLAASQEVKLGEPDARDMVFLHGLGNTGVMLGTVGLTLWRLRREPTVTQGLLGLLACGVAVYTATLGGKMVYEYGVGINPMPPGSSQGTSRGPALLSREAPKALLRDAAQGLGWLAARVRRLFSGEQPLSPGAKGFGEATQHPTVLASDLPVERPVTMG